MGDNRLCFIDVTGQVRINKIYDNDPYTDFDLKACFNTGDKIFKTKGYVDIQSGSDYRYKFLTVEKQGDRNYLRRYELGIRNSEIRKVKEVVLLESADVTSVDFNREYITVGFESAGSFGKI